jgi:hypothetical protein
VATRRLALEVAQLCDLGRQPAPALGLRRGGVEAAEIQLVDDGQHEDLEGHHVHLRAAGHDLELVADGVPR